MNDDLLYNDDNYDAVERHKEHIQRDRQREYMLMAFTAGFRSYMHSAPAAPFESKVITDRFEQWMKENGYAYLLTPLP